MRTALAAGLIVITIAALTAPAGGGGRLRPSGISSADLRLSAGHAKTILSIRGLGRWTASCSARARVSVTFTADFLLPTSDLVITRTAGRPLARRIDPGDIVTPDRAATVISQHWQIAPFAAAQVQVSSATVTARRVDARTCSASVVVVTGPDQGATRTAAFTNTADLAWTPPAGWRDVGPRLTAVGEPGAPARGRDVRAPPDAPDRTCSPETARRQMPPDGALVLLLESRESHREGSAAARPRFRLGPQVNLECFGARPDGRLGRAGPGAAGGRDVRPAGPAPSAGGKPRRCSTRSSSSRSRRLRRPPAGASSSRTPPTRCGSRPAGRPARSGTSRRRRGRGGCSGSPTATARSSYGSVEHRRGPVSAAFPPAGEPLVFDAHRRAGMAWRGFRFSIRIFARAGAPARDLEWAEISARTLGVSGAGRG